MTSPFGGPPLHQIPRGMDPMEFGVLQMTAEIEAEVDKRGWDQLHMVWVIRRDLNDLPQLGPGALIAGFGMNLVHIIEDIPDPMTPDDYLMRFTDPAKLKAMLHEYGEVPLDEIQALVFVGEAWGVFSEDATGAAETARLHAERKLHTHAQRKEIRQLVTIDRAERRYSVVRMRGQSNAQRLVTADPAGSSPFEGGRGLLAMMRTLQTL